MLSRLRFSFKLALFPLATALLVGLVLAIAPRFTAETEATLGRIETAHVPTVEACRDLETILARLQRTLQDAAVAENEEALADADAERDEFVASVAAVRSHGVVPAASLDALEADFAGYYVLARRTTVEMIAQGMSETTVEAARDMTARYGALRDRLHDQTQRERDRMGAAFHDASLAHRSAREAFAVLAVVSVVALLLLVLLTARINRLTISQLRFIEGGFERIARGDFSAPVEVVLQDEVGSLATRINTLSTTLNELLRKLTGGSDTVAGAAAGIFSATREQETLAAQQSTALEEVRQTIDSLAASAEHVAKDAESVRDLASRSLSSAQRIGDQAKLVSAHSEKIGQILQLIQDIADKSDILALNAALEGTRAGEVGRGFSLVAAEMRRLSEHVKDSVRDIRKLVADMREAAHTSVLSTEEGTRLARETAGSAASISDAVGRQREGTTQVRSAAAEIVVVVGSALAGTAEAARAAESLMQVSQELKRAAGAFRLADGTHGRERAD